MRLLFYSPKKRTVLLFFFKTIGLCDTIIITMKGAIKYVGKNDNTI